MSYESVKRMIFGELDLAQGASPEKLRDELEKQLERGATYAVAPDPDPKRKDFPFLFRRIGDPFDRSADPVTFCMGARGEDRSGYADYAGEEEPVSEVSIHTGFYLGVFPALNPGKGAAVPATQVSYFDALERCNQLANDWQKNLAGFKVCPPSEAYWEYACRAGTQSEYHSGDGVAALREAGWFVDNCSELQPVGEKLPNAFGLYDMHGSVWEWCQDVFRKRRYRERGFIPGEPDPVAVESIGAEDRHERRVLRGGSWDDPARSCRSAFRYRSGPGLTCGRRGFRVCLLPGPVEHSKQEAEPRIQAAESSCGGRADGGTPEATPPPDDGVDLDQPIFDRKRQRPE